MCHDATCVTCEFWLVLVPVYGRTHQATRMGMSLLHTCLSTPYHISVLFFSVNCTDPGTPANSQREGHSFLYRDSVTYTCNHGYYQSEGPEGGVRTCQQNGLWSGVEPVCTGRLPVGGMCTATPSLSPLSACTAIDNCADVRCTNATDHQCMECASYHGDTLGMAGYENLGTECQRKFLPPHHPPHPFTHTPLFPTALCSWLQGFCYPGTCSDGLASCNCSSGFAGPDCLNSKSHDSHASSHMTHPSLQSSFPQSFSPAPSLFVT